MAQRKKFQTSLQSSVGSLCTRSQVAPDWTVKEMLVLVNEVATLHKDTLKSLPSCQKWRMISENCATVEVVRSSNQCRRQWEQILAEYKKIREWEIQHGPGSYWWLESQRKFEFELPPFFDRELFEAIAKFLNGQEPQSDSEVESEAEGLNSPIEDGMLNLFTLHGPQKKRGRGRPRKHSTEQILAAKLVEDAQLVQTILRGDLPRNGSMDIEQASDSQAKFAINQGDGLIKVFGPQKKRGRGRPRKHSTEQILGAKLVEDAQFVQTVLPRNGSMDIEQASDSQAKFAINQGDEFIKVFGPQKKRGPGRPRKHNTEEILAAKLVEDAQLVQTILRGDLPRNGSMDIEQASDSQEKFAINQGDELIKVFGPQKKRGPGRPRKHNTEEILAAKLVEDAQLVQTILRGDLPRNGSLDIEQASDSQAKFAINQGEELIKVFGPQKKRGRGRPRKHSTEQILMAKLVEDAHLVQTILRGDLPRNGSMDIEHASDSQAKFAINQGDELIKVFSTLVGKLDQLVDCVKQRV